MTSHDYLSTACQHGLHDRCRLVCKYCDTPCRCDCHRGATTMTTPAQALTNLAHSLPKDQADDGPIGVKASDVRTVVDAVHADQERATEPIGTVDLGSAAIPDGGE